MAKHKEPERRIYVDSNVLIHLIEHPQTDAMSKLIESVLSDASGKSPRFDVVTSTITIAEVLFAHWERDSHAIDPLVEEKINKLWHPSSPIRLVEVHELIVREAVAEIREGIKNGWAKTGGIDAIHVITAKNEKVHEFFSIGPEQAMKKWGEKFSFEVVEPHYEPKPEDVKAVVVESSVEAVSESDFDNLFKDVVQPVIQAISEASSDPSPVSIEEHKDEQEATAAIAKAETEINPKEESRDVKLIPVARVPELPIAGPENIDLPEVGVIEGLAKNEGDRPPSETA